MAKKLTRKQLSDLRGEYLAKREELLRKKVDALGVRLFDEVYNNYLLALSQTDGKLVLNDQNVSLVKGLDAVYNSFVINYNIPVIGSFVKDAKGVIPLNERYFKNLTGKDLTTRTETIKGIVDRRLGVDAEGNPTENGFVDKFIKDKSVLRKIKRETMKALTQGKGFQEFRADLKKVIQGVPNEKLSGGLQQYYRNYAYSVFAQVDTLVADKYASDLALRYFFYTGGIIKTSRELCIRCDGKIVDSEKVKNLKYSDLKEIVRPGLNEDWQFIRDLGQQENGCRHRKDYVLDSFAEQRRADFLDIQTIIK